MLFQKKKQLWVKCTKSLMADDAEGWTPEHTDVVGINCSHTHKGGGSWKFWGQIQGHVQAEF